MSMFSDILDLRNLVLSRGRSENSNQPTRAGSILFEHRPAYLLTGDAMAANAPDARGMEPHMALLRQRTADMSPSVGRVEVAREDGTWQPTGTCFRVPGGPTRVVTSGHMLIAMLGRDGQVREAFPFDWRGALRPTRVTFGAVSWLMTDVVWAHAKWDLLVFDLEPAAAAIPPLPIETAVAWGPPADNPVAVIGFPMSADPLATPTEIEALFGGRINHKCTAPGLSLCRQTMPTFARNFAPAGFWLGHDASTLPGNSGSPLVSLVTGRVVGVHGDPGRRGAAMRLNGAVDLSLACAEPALNIVIAGPAGAAPGAPQMWDRPAPAWRGQGEMSAPPRPGSAALSSVQPDRSDFRDFPYSPTLRRPADQILPPGDAKCLIRNQGDEASCVGLALAAVIERQLQELGRPWTAVSARMLYEAAREQDEFLDLGGDPGGTSLRAAIKGFHHNGTCAEETAPYHPGDSHWTLPIAAAIQAREVTLGAYYRIERRLTDMQSAIAEAGAVVVSARIHGGWFSDRAIRKIPHRSGRSGTHAFALVGYDADGFILQNSWGEAWGSWNDQPGLAHWSYEDWADNVIDAWVFRLSPRAPGALNLTSRPQTAATSRRATTVRPRRSSVLGHIAQTETGGIVNSGKLAPGLAALRETALFLGNTLPANLRKGRDGGKYRDIAIFLHDPLLPPDAPARITSALIEDFKARKIYPLHVFHGLDAAQTFMARMVHEARTATQRYRLTGDELSAWLAQRANVSGRDIIAGLADSARIAADPRGAVHDVLSALLSEVDLAEGLRRIHLIGTGLGAITALQLASLDPRDLPRGIVSFASLTTLDALLLREMATPDIAGAHLVTPDPGPTAASQDAGDLGWPAIARSAAGTTFALAGTRLLPAVRLALPEAVTAPGFSRAVLTTIMRSRKPVAVTASPVAVSVA